MEARMTALQVPLDLVIALAPLLAMGVLWLLDQ
jgi:hypothetical protein